MMAGIAGTESRVQNRGDGSRGQEKKVPPVPKIQRASASDIAASIASVHEFVDSTPENPRSYPPEGERPVCDAASLTSALPGLSARLHTFNSSPKYL